MQRLECAIRPYAWGSHTAIAALQGRSAPTPQPEAELWVGAHPTAPSRVGGVALSERIAADPVGLLGGDVAERFDGRLPLLLKVLAAAEPLSLQAHPDAAQAAAGYAAEKAAGVPLGAAHRRYPDPYHKPELLVALSDFRALCGFRRPERAAALLQPLSVPALEPLVRALSDGDLASGVRWLLGLRQQEPAQGARLVGQVAEAAAAFAEPPYALVVELAERYPEDVAVVVALLLHYVTLRPGEGIFMPAGNLHAYLSGTAVEVMAASDNVLRGGFTGKHVDVDELLRVLRFEPLDDPVHAAVPVAPGVVTWPAPVPEFALHRVTLPGPATVGAADAVHLELPGPRLVLALGGQVQVADADGAVTLSSGEAAFSPGGQDGPLVFTGAGEAFIASVP